MREVEKRTKIIADQSKSDSNGKKNFLDAKERKQLQNKISKIEAEISKLEKAIIHDDAEILENFDEVNANPLFFAEYQAKKDKVSDLVEDWERLQEKVDML